MIFLIMVYRKLATTLWNQLRSSIVIVETGEVCDLLDYKVTLLRTSGTETYVDVSLTTDYIIIFYLKQI